MTEQKLQTELKRIYSPVANGTEAHLSQLLRTFAELNWDEPFAPFIMALTFQEIRDVLIDAHENAIQLDNCQLLTVQHLFEHYEKLGL